jgi:hypothetical protein
VQTQVDAKIAKSTVTAKGDLLVATGSGTVVAQAVGTDGQFLKANSAQADGVEWATVSQYALPSQTGNSGKFLTTNGTTESWGTVTQPVTWTERLNPNTAWTANCIASNGSNIWVAAGDAGVLYSSTDSGVTWTLRTSGFGANSIRGLAYGNGIFVAVGAGGQCFSSTDGITWTSRAAGLAGNVLNNVRYVNSVFIICAAGAAGGTGGIATSTDGITWTKRTTPASTSSNLYDVAYGNGYYVAVGAFTTTAGIYSTNLSTWTALPTTITQDGMFIHYNGSGFFVHAGNATSFFTGNNPTTGWSTCQEGLYINYQTNYAFTTINTYSGSYYYWVNPHIGIATTPTSINSTSKLWTGTIRNPIPTPARFSNNTGGGTPIYVLYTDSSGKICIADQYGRLFTGQL